MTVEKFILKRYKNKIEINVQIYLKIGNFEKFYVDVDKFDGKIKYNSLVREGNYSENIHI
jgi:hypothetical protein